MPDASIHCCVTSPPYWGLRDYGCDGQLGLERTPDEYVAEMVAVFREVRRVLREDGTLWLNLGDSYANNGASGPQGKTGQRASRAFTAENLGSGRMGCVPAGLKAKDLIGIPWRVAFALQADGWWLRSDIIWAKPNPMPESVTDRPTKAHEYVFLLAKAERYFFDAEAVKEGDSGKPSGNGFKRPERLTYDGRGKDEEWLPGGGRNIRTVWPIATQPFPGSHFAVMPPALAERCIKAGTSEHGCCGACGAPFERIAERDEQPQAYEDRKYDSDDPRFATKRNMGARYQAQLDANPKVTKGWRATCACENAPRVPCTVLDPFAGAGTTGLVADRLGRSFIGIELNPEYAQMAQRRIYDDAPLLNLIQ